MQPICAETFMMLNKWKHALCLKSAPLKGLESLVESSVTKSTALKGLPLLNAFTYYEFLCLT